MKIRRLKKIKSNLKKVIDYEKDMSVDTQFFSKFIYIYSFLLFVLGFVFLYRKLPYMTIMAFLFSVIVFLLAVFLNKSKNKRHFRTAFFIASIFIYFVIYICTAYGITKGFSNFFVLMLCNISVYSFGIVFSLWYDSIVLAYIILFFWTKLGDVLQLHIGNVFALIESTTGIALKQQVYQYSSTYRLVYPLIFITWFILILMSDYYIRLSQIKEKKLESKLEHELEKALEKTELQMFEGFTSIIKVIDEKDNYTKSHSIRVAEYSKLIAVKLGIQDEKALQNIYRAAMLHDIGKIAIPDNILNKNQRLSDKEYELMKLHTTYGYNILSKLDFFPDAAICAVNHHERLDGSGYPSGLTENEIPFIAKIVSAADTLDAMNSNRIYRKQCSKDYIISEFTRIKGSLIDSKVSDIVCQLIEEGKIETV